MDSGIDVGQVAAGGGVIVELAVASELVDA